MRTPMSRVRAATLLGACALAVWLAGGGTAPAHSIRLPEGQHPEKKGAAPLKTGGPSPSSTLFGGRFCPLEECLFADAADAKTKQENGFDLTDYDKRALKFAKAYSEKLLAIDINIEINAMLDTGWRLLGEYFTKEEAGIRQDLTERYWVGKEGETSPEEPEESTST